MTSSDLLNFLPHKICSQETYFKAMANAPIVVAEGDEDIEVEYDSDGYPIIPDRAKVSLRPRPLH